MARLEKDDDGIARGEREVEEVEKVNDGGGGEGWRRKASE
jgi:hypothetical protein